MIPVILKALLAFIPSMVKSRSDFKNAFKDNPKASFAGIVTALIAVAGSNGYPISVELNELIIRSCAVITLAFALYSKSK